MAFQLFSHRGGPIMLWACAADSFMWNICCSREETASTTAKGSCVEEQHIQNKQFLNYKLLAGRMSKNWIL